MERKIVLKKELLDTFKKIGVMAWGRYAKYLTENHDLSNIFGDGSPIGKLYELDGYVLLIGVGYDKNTSLHLADVRADYPGKHNIVEGRK